MRFAYADPPYLGCCALYSHEHDVDGRCWDEAATHAHLIQRLQTDFPDGWALSASSSSLATLLPMCPTVVRVSPWVKPFASFKPNVNPAYAWEPVIWRGGRKRTREEPTVRDWYTGNITLRRGLTGAKPDGFCFWIFDLLNMQSGDELIDLYPGTGAVTTAWQRHGQRLPLSMVAP
jgi:hypothetical protein